MFLSQHLLNISGGVLVWFMVDKEKAIVPIETALAERQQAIVKAENRLAEVKKQKKGVKQKIPVAKRMALNPYLHNIDEIKRGTAKYMRRYVGSVAGWAGENAGYSWLNDLEIELDKLCGEESELFKKLDELKESVVFLKKMDEELTPEKAYKLLRKTAKKHRINIPHQISVESARYAYHELVKVYNPNNFAEYSYLTRVLDKVEAEEKFKEIVLTMGSCYKKVRCYSKQ